MGVGLLNLIHYENHPMEKDSGSPCGHTDGHHRSPDVPQLPLSRAVPPLRTLVLALIALALLG